MRTCTSTGAPTVSWRRPSRDHFRILTIDVDYPDFPPLPNQQRDAVSLHKRYPGRVAFAGAFSVEDFHRRAGADGVAGLRERRSKKGAVGVKIWKNIGMSCKRRGWPLRDAGDPRFEPVFARLERITWCCSVTRPSRSTAGCPLEQMTVRSDREYFAEHPQY